MDGTSDLRPTQRLDSLTGARFLAAGTVFLTHIATGGIFSGTSAAVLSTVTKSAATIGVSFFFVLSGFVMTWSARDGDSWGRFFRRRFLRIFPNHVVTFALAMLLFAAGATPVITALLNLALLQAWHPDPAVFLSVNGVSWSLSCEIFFYALFPLLLPLVRRIGARRLWWWAGGVVAVIVALPLVAGLLPADPAFPATGASLDNVSIVRLWFLYIFPLTRLLDFVLGMLMARIVLSGQWIGLRSGWAGLLAVGGYVLGVYTPMLYTVDAATIVPLALLIAALASSDNAGTGTFLGRPPMRWLGEISFAFYLLHSLVITSIRTALGEDRALTTVQGVLIAVLALVVSVVLAAALHHGVEGPAARRWGRSRRSGASSPGAGSPDRPAGRDRQTDVTPA